MLFNRLGGFVEFSADVVLEILEVLPSGTLWHVEGFVVFILVFGELFGLLLRLALVQVVLDDAFLCLFIGIGQALQEQHPEDVVLELRGIHAAPQDVGALPQKRFQLAERQFLADLKGGFHALAVGCNGFAGSDGWRCPIATRRGGAFGQGNGATAPAALANQADSSQPLLGPIVFLLADTPACGLLQGFQGSLVAKHAAIGRQQLQQRVVQVVAVF